MYEIRPESAKTFITDRNISLPRFQRKQTWDEKKNFQLCISVFKGYPLGVCIVSTEKDGTKTKKYLLDGRQRKNALLQMYENPEIIGIWAKKFIKFKNGIDLFELEELCKEKINEYLEADDEIDAEDEIKSTDDEEDDDESENSDDITEDNTNTSNDGLSLLIEVIKRTYQQKKHSSTFTAPFDITKFIDDLPYVDQDVRNGYRINGKKLKSFIIEYRTDCENEDISYIDNSDTFANYLIRRGRIKDNVNDQKLKTEIKEKWKYITERFELIEKIDNVIADCKIGIIEVQGFKPADSQKIFNIINSEGVKLTAVEILSAKSYWNKRIENPSPDLLTEAKELYEKMGIKISDVYRWDIPATLLARLGENVIFRKLSWDSIKNKSEFEKKLTIGFQIMAGIYKEGITKDDIDALGKASSDWSSESDSLVKTLLDIIRLIEDFSYFNYFKSWNTSIMELTSDAIALNYLLLLYFDYIRKGKPIGHSTKTKQFQKNCFILWDSLIYEYIRKQWRGSSDSMIARNIKDIKTNTDMFNPIDKQKWLDLLSDISKNSKIEETNVSIPLMKPILYHMYCLAGMRGPDNSPYPIEVDHIIPQYLFKSSTLENKDIIQDNLYNLGLLPKKDNISKSNCKLNEITNTWLKDQVEYYEFISKDSFEKYSDLNNYRKLFDERKKRFDMAFGPNRDFLLNN